MSDQQNITREMIAAAALTLVDRPYGHQGRDYELDCAGVLVATFRKLGVELQEETVNYRRLPPEVHIVRCLLMNFEPTMTLDDLLAGEEISADDVEEGDIVHIKFKRDTQARHLGIIVAGASELMIVHALRTHRRVLLDLLRGALTNARIVGIYSWPALQS